MKIYRKINLLILIPVGFLAIISCKPVPKNISRPSVIYEGIEFAMPVVEEPVIPANSVSITDFGAVGDGQALNTKAFESAIEAVSGKGGGKVVVPRGIWLTGPIILKDNIEIHAEAGSLVVFSRDKSLYPLVETSFEGYNTVRCMSPIYGKGLTNIAFTGEGIFDGSGDAWRMVKKSKLTSAQWKDLVDSGGVVNEKGDTWYPSESFIKGEAMGEMNVPRQLKSMEEFETVRDFLRPVMVSLVGCRKVLFDGPTFQNSPAWCLHPLMCENLTIRNIMVRNPWYSQNGDGVDIESCKNSVIYNSRFDVGDDAICIKSGKDEDGRARGIPTENLIIKNCIVYHGHGGVTIGSEMSGGVKNLHASQCTFIGTDVGLRFKSNRGRGGVVENIYMSDIEMMDIPTHAISFNLYYGGQSVSEMLTGTGNKEVESEMVPVTEETPEFRDITIKNITCKGAMQAVFLQGLPEMNLKNIRLENLNIISDYGFSCIDTDGLIVKGLKMTVKKLPLFSFCNSKNCRFEDFRFPVTDSVLVNVSGTKTGNITFDSALPGLKNLSTGKDVDEKAIQFLK